MNSTVQRQANITCIFCKRSLSFSATEKKMEKMKRERERKTLGEGENSLKSLVSCRYRMEAANLLCPMDVNELIT